MSARWLTWVVPSRCPECGQRDLLLPLGCAIGGGSLAGAFGLFPLPLTILGFVGGWALGVRGTRR